MRKRKPPKYETPELANAAVGFRTVVGPQTRALGCDCTFTIQVLTWYEGAELSPNLVHVFHTPQCSIRIEGE